MVYQFTSWANSAAVNVRLLKRNVPQRVDELPRRGPVVLVAWEQVVQAVEHHQLGAEVQRGVEHLAEERCHLPVRELAVGPLHERVQLADTRHEAQPFNHASAVEIVPRNVATIIKPPALEKPDIQILASDQVTDAMAKLAGLSIYPIFSVALGTGARRGEIAALRWSDIDLDAAAVRIERALEQTKDGIRVKTPKTSAGRRTISLPAFAVDALRDHRVKTLELRLALGAGALPAGACVFGDHEGNVPNPYSISDRWRDAVKSRKLPKVTFHALRHTHASALINAGLDVVAIARRLGHASPTITLGTYAHLFHHDDSAAAAAIDAALGSENRK